MKSPGYWMHETSGELRPAVAVYLAGGQMTDAQIAAMRAYLRQWIAAWGWAEAETLRASVDGLVSRQAIAAWLSSAEEIGIDPL